MSRSFIEATNIRYEIMMKIERRNNVFIYLNPKHYSKFLTYPNLFLLIYDKLFLVSSTHTKVAKVVLSGELCQFKALWHFAEGLFNLSLFSGKEGFLNQCVVSRK